MAVQFADCRPHENIQARVINVMPGQGRAKVPPSEKIGKWLGWAGSVIAIGAVIYYCGSTVAAFQAEFKFIRENMARKDDVRRIEVSMNSLIGAMDSLLQELDRAKLRVNTDAVRKHLPTKFEWKVRYDDGREILRAVASVAPKRDGDSLVYLVNRPNEALAGFSGTVRISPTAKDPSSARRRRKMWRSFSSKSTMELAGHRPAGPSP